MDDTWAPVSVVIPCYNCKETVERAAASVFSQTRRPREIILVDDASRDDPASLFSSLKNRYGNRIRIVQRRENGGPGAARNTGWDLARQPFVAFLDADDAWHVRKIEIQAGYMEAHQEVALTGHRLRWESPPGLPLDGPIPRAFKTQTISPWKMLFVNKLWTSTVMVRRHLPFRFEKSKRFSEDYLLWLTILLSGYPCVFLDIELAYYYKRPFGEPGLTQHLWAMERNELDTFKRLRGKGRLPWPLFFAATSFSLAKYIRRIMRMIFQKGHPKRRHTQK